MSNQTPLSLVRDINGYVTYGLTPSVQGANIVLASDTLKTFTVPVGPAAQYLAIFSYYAGANVWVLFGSTPTLTLPTATATSTTAELNPTARLVEAGTTIQIRAVSAASGVGVKYYAL